MSDVDTARRDRDGLVQVAWEVKQLAEHGGTPDLSERDAMAALAERALLLAERLQAIVDWADFALAQPNEFNSHGVRNLDGPVFDEARTALAALGWSCPIGDLPGRTGSGAYTAEDGQLRDAALNPQAPIKSEEG